MNVILKLTCTMMYKRSQRYVNENNIVNAEQIGFNRGARISGHILTINTLVNKYVGDQKGKTLYASFVDFKKAFDSVSQDLLYQKPLNQNISVNFLALLKNIYKKRKCEVKINMFRTNFFTYTKGLR